MRCQDYIDDYNARRCKRTASKIAIVKQTINEKQSKLWICDDCFNEKMYSNQVFKKDLIQVTELNKNINEFFFQS
jgi:phage pi2 protein 07